MPGICHLILDKIRLDMFWKTLDLGYQWISDIILVLGSSADKNQLRNFLKNIYNAVKNDHETIWILLSSCWNEKKMGQNQSENDRVYQAYGKHIRHHLES